MILFYDPDPLRRIARELALHLLVSLSPRRSTFVVHVVFRCAQLRGDRWRKCFILGVALIDELRRKRVCLSRGLSKRTPCRKSSGISLHCTRRITKGHRAADSIPPPASVLLSAPFRNARPAYSTCRDVDESRLRFGRTLRVLRFDRLGDTSAGTAVSACDVRSVARIGCTWLTSRGDRNLQAIGDVATCTNIRSRYKTRGSPPVAIGQDSPNQISCSPRQGKPSGLMINVSLSRSQRNRAICPQHASCPRGSGDESWAPTTATGNKSCPKIAMQLPVRSFRVCFLLAVLLALH